MSINDLTIGDIKELKAMFGGDVCSTSEQSSILSGAIGKYVIVRSRNEGINAGVLKVADNTGCVLSEARRIWYHKPKDNKTAWYEGVADNGLHSDSKISCEVKEKYIIEDYSISVCTSEAEKSIRDAVSHAS
jgi:hypothetical protein